MKYAEDRHQPEGDWVKASTVEKVVGVQHHRQHAEAFALASKLAEKKGLLYGLRLEREPDNPNDKNAIAVWGVSETKSWFRKKTLNWKIGYLSRELATELIREFVDKDIPIAAELYSIYESDRGFLDFSILILAPSGHSVSARARRKR